MVKASVFFLGLYLAYLLFMSYNTIGLIEKTKDNMNELTNTIDQYER